MIYRTESKLRGWRAVAVFADGSECLVYLGRSTTQVRANYAVAYAELLDEEAHRLVREVALECWQGAADAGRWIRKSILAIPCREPLTLAELKRHACGSAVSPSTAAEDDLTCDELSGSFLFDRSRGNAEKARKRLHPVGVS